MLNDIITFNEYECHIVKKSYSNGRLALQLMNAKSLKEPNYSMQLGTECIATVTINLPNEDIADDEIFIKNYSENEGMLEALLEANVISKPIKYVKIGFVEVPLCKILI